MSRKRLPLSEGDPATRTKTLIDAATQHLVASNSHLVDATGALARGEFANAARSARKASAALSTGQYYLMVLESK